jgi:hypothetical protein
MWGNGASSDRHVSFPSPRTPNEVEYDNRNQFHPKDSKISGTERAAMKALLSGKLSSG